MIILSLSNGFNYEIKKILASARGHYRIDNKHQSLQSINNIKKQLSDNPDFLTYSDYTEDYGIIKKGNKVEGVTIVGLEDHKIFDIFNTSFSKKDLLAKGSTDIIIGGKIADNMNLQIGDSLMLLITNNQSFENNRFAAKHIVVSNIFNSGFDYYDQFFCFLRLPDSQIIFAANHLEEGITGIVKNPIEINSSSKIFNSLDKRFNNITTWVEWSARSLEWLDAYRMPIVFVAILILIIAACNMALSLWTLVQGRLSEIAILLSMGFTRTMISMILIIQSFVLTLLGIFLAIIFSFFILFIQSEYKFIEISKEIYHISYIPVLINYNEIFLYSIGLLILTSIISLFPAYKLYSVNPMKHLNDE